MVIDAHHHFWRYTAAEYGWIDGPMAALRRDFLPADLRLEAAAAGVDGVISVQARQTVEETRWLLELAAANADFIRGVVGWVPLASPDVEDVLNAFAAHGQLRAVRHVVQGEPDDRFILGADFHRGVALLERFGLRYDILIFERQLPPAIEFVDRHPGITFVLDHVAKPKIKTGELHPWRTNIGELARRPNVYCKVSGMVTEADWQNWTPDGLRPYFDTVLEAFGPRRLMFGSDWPVCLVGASYRNWVETVRAWCSRLSTAERARVFGETAVEAYGLDGTT